MFVCSNCKNSSRPDPLCFSWCALAYLYCIAYCNTSRSTKKATCCRVLLYVVLGLSRGDIPHWQDFQNYSGEGTTGVPPARVFMVMSCQFL